MKNKIRNALLLTVASSVVALGASFSGGLDPLENATWSVRVRTMATKGEHTDQIKLILLDQSSLDWGSEVNGLSWPWPREVYAPIISFVKRGGAKALAFDVLYLESSAYGVADDEQLGGAIENGPPFVAALMTGQTTGRFTRWPDASPPQTGLQEKGIDPQQVLASSHAALPIEEVRKSADILSDVRGLVDEDGVVRRAVPFRSFDGHVFSSLGAGAYVASFMEEKGRKPVLQKTRHTFELEDQSIPVDQEGGSLLRYRGPPGTYERFSAAEIIQSELMFMSGMEPPVSPDVFKDAYVLFGFSAPGLYDIYPVPLSATAPGVEVHATILDNLLGEDFLRDSPLWANLLLVVVLSFFAAISLFYSGAGWKTGGALTGVLILPLPLSLVLYAAGFRIPLVMTELAVLLSSTGAILWSYLTEGKQKAFIKSAFKQYLSPHVIDGILKDPGRLQLGGEKRELSIFFSDLQGFSSISEKLSPQDLTHLLNDYLSDMTDIILEEGGTLDKYEGDAIIAFWNAPLSQEDHVQRACRATVRCQNKLAERRAEFKDRTGFELRMRIGLNTGDVVVGNMGSSKRFDYTMLGDAANLAARLEGANKPFGTYTMVSEECFRRSGLPGREIGRIRVVGRKTPVRVFELENSESLPAPDPEAYRKGLEELESLNFDNALEFFDRCKGDPLAKLYGDRIRKKLTSPEDEWDGIWNLTEK